MQNGKKSSFPNKLDKEKRMLRDYARYSNLAFKLIAVILAAFFIGWQIDKWINIGFPLFTLLLSIGGLIITMYLLIKDL
ncbi:MAG: AtpZ/AtpI family protein [Porphyromonadaceae bacterium]|nr:MAG: AtpZ/AtpI family protein [Porphyromonadaceae bacterium]